MPLASRGCFSCRTKKQKCDQSVPSCRKCLNTGRLCPGYRSELDMAFRDMNQETEQKVKSRINSRKLLRSFVVHNSPGQLPTASGPRSQEQESFHPHDHEKLGLQTQFSRNIPQQIGIDWKGVAVPRFFNDYVFHFDSGCTSFYFFRTLWESNRNCVHFKQALEAVAFLNLANQENMPWLRDEATKLYCLSLSRVSGLLQNDEDAYKDTTLATIHIFGIYETIYGHKVAHKRWDPHHHNGRMILLRLWDKKELRTQLETFLFRSNFSHLTIKCLALHLEHADEAESWLELMDIGSSPHHLATCNVHAVRLLFKVQKLFETKERDDPWILQLLQAIKEALLLDAEYQEWNESNTGVWLPRTIRTANLPTSARSIFNAELLEIFPQQIFHDIYIAFVWNNYRSSRIHLHEVLLRCIFLISTHPCAQTLSLDFTNTISASKTIISDLVADICACSSFCLGIIDSTGKPTNITWPLCGYLIYWPTYVAMISSSPSNQRTTLLRGNLEYVANVLGIGTAKILIDRERPDPWDLRS